MRRWLVLAIPLIVLGLLAGCGGGGGGGGGGGSGDAQTAVLVTDAPVDDLSSLALTLTEVTLVDGAGSETRNLLAAPARLELLDLTGRQALLALASLPAGTFEEVRATIDASSVDARDPAGNPVAITVNRALASAVLPAPLVVSHGSSARLRLDVRLDDSLVRREGRFELELEIRGDSPSGRLDLDELRGLVTAEQPDASTFQVEIVSGDDRVPFGGTLGIAIDATSVLLGDDGVVFASPAAFFAALQTGDLIEVHGQLQPDSSLRATSVEIEDHPGVARIEGFIVGLDTAANQLELRIQDIEHGRDRVRAQIGDAATITVAWNDSTVFVHHDDRRDDRHHGDDDRDGDDDGDGGGDDDRGGDDHGGGRGDEGEDDHGGHHGDDDGDHHGPASEVDLAVGQRIDVTFLAFESSPFLAHKLQIDDGRPDFEGRIVDTAGLPASLVMHLEPHDPAVLSGLVASSQTDVIVDLAGLTATFVDGDDEPDIDPGTLLPGLRIHVRGTISGPPAAPVIAATVIRVRPGELRGTLVSIDAATHTVVIDVARIDDPFGGPPLADPATLVLASGARFDGEAGSEAALIALFQGLGSGEHIALRAEGLGDGSGGGRLFEIKSQVQH